MGRAGKSCDESRVILYLLLFFPVTLLSSQEFPACPLFYPVQRCSETDDFVLYGPLKVRIFQNKNMKSSYCPKNERKI